MSRIYFKDSGGGFAEILGSERAHMTITLSELAFSFVPTGMWSKDRLLEKLRPSFERPSNPDNHTDWLWFVDRLKLHMAASGRESLFFHEGKPLSTFSLILNTALAVGSDALALFAKIHGACEIHARVEGPDRAWVADVIQQGLDSGLYRKGMGWPDLQVVLRERDDLPVVTSFSVTGSFPNEWIAQQGGWQPELDEEDEPVNEDEFSELEDEERWRYCMTALRADSGTTVISPEGLRRRFGHEKSFLDLFGS